MRSAPERGHHFSVSKRNIPRPLVQEAFPEIITDTKLPMLEKCLFYHCFLNMFNLIHLVSEVESEVEQLQFPTQETTPSQPENFPMQETMPPDLRPHICCSGINHGANLGDDATYSGTVAGALESTILGHKFSFSLIASTISA